MSCFAFSPLSLFLQEATSRWAPNLWQAVVIHCTDAGMCEHVATRVENVKCNPIRMIKGAQIEMLLAWPVFPELQLWEYSHSCHNITTVYVSANLWIKLQIY